MKLILNHIGLASTNGIDAWIEKQLGSLAPRLQIDAARVRLVRSRDTSPAYRAHVHIVTPGPDVFAEGSDHTLRAAVTKVLKQLRNKIAERTGRRLQRTKSNLWARADRAAVSRTH